MPVSKGIKVKINWVRKSHTAFCAFLRSIYSCLLGNQYYPNPPGGLAALQEITDRYSAAIIDAMDGGRIAISLRDSLRQTADSQLRLIAAYVEYESNDDPAIFETSGFEAYPNSYKPHQPLETPRILKIAHGVNSGVLLFWLTPSHKKIVHYELRYAVHVDGTPESWTVETITSSKFPYSVSGLIPATRYTFQVRALGKTSQFTDWSNPVTFIAT